MSFQRQGALLNALMLAGLAAAIVAPAQRFVPAWQPIYLVAACFLVAIEASVVHHAFERERMNLSELARYLVPELVVMLVLMRVATLLSLGLVALPARARGWLDHPLSIFDPLFIAAIVAGLIIGWLAHVALHDLAELGPQLPDTPAISHAEEQEAISALAEARGQALRQINRRFIVGGMLLLIALALDAINLEQITGPGRTISTLSALGALTYMACGFLLYSQARLVLLQTRWRFDGAQVAPTVARRWGRASRLIIGGVLAAMLLLPRGYGLSLFDTLAALLSLVGYIVALVGYFLLWVLSLLLIIPAWLASLFGSPSRPPEPIAPIRPPAVPDAPPAIHQPHLWSALVFWGCMLILSGYALWLVLQRNPQLLRWLKEWAPLAWLLRQLRSLWADTRDWTGQVLQQARRIRQRRSAAVSQQRRPWLRLGALAPRELVRYFYRSTLRRAAERGLGRPGGQTPYEYELNLVQRLPEARPEIAELTEAFVVAQYSARPVGTDAARRARRPWERVRRMLRAIPRPHDEVLAVPARDAQAQGEEQFDADGKT